MALKGARELKARLKEVKLTFKDYGRTWGDNTASEMRRRVPVDTGRLKNSIRRRNATQRKAVVVGHYTANFVSGGSKAHDITPRNFHGPFFGRKGPILAFEVGGRTIFTKKVHKARIAPRPFKRKSAEAALKKHPIRQTMIDLWNRAA